MPESPLFAAMSGLDPEQLFVIVSVYWGEVTEPQIARDLTELRGVPVSRDRVHRIRLTAEAKIGRHLRPLVEAAA